MGGIRVRTGIQVKGISKKIGDQQILEDVDITCLCKSITGIIGRNGSGKTVLLKCICGLLKPDKGNIYILEKSGNEEALRLGSIGALIEIPSFLSNYSGLKNLELLYGIHNRVNRKYLKEIMLSVGLDPEKRKAVKKYSIGMKQRLGIAQAIMEKQEIVILDEPMNGLDIEGVQQIKQLLIQLKNEGRTILLASHNHEDIEELCDAVYEMSMGKVEQKK